MTALITYADGAHRENLIVALPRIRKWAKLFNVSVFPIIGGCPEAINGGSTCFKKIWALKEVMGYTGEPSPMQIEHGNIAPDELVIWMDCDTVFLDYKKADPAQLEKQLGQADICCMFHPSPDEAKARGQKRAWMNGGVFAFRNTQKMRDYWNRIWIEKAPYVDDEGFPADVAVICRAWYKRRWTKGTDEMALSRDVYNGILTASEMDKRWNICYETRPDPNTGLSDLDGAYILHWAWENDKEVVLRRQKTMIRQLESKPETR